LVHYHFLDRNRNELYSTLFGKQEPSKEANNLLLGTRKKPRAPKQHVKWSEEKENLDKLIEILKDEARVL